MTVKFEGQDRREATLAKVLPEYGFKSLEEARDIVTEVPELNEKPYKLIDYDKFVQEIKDKGYEKELKDRSQKMADWNKKIGQRFMDRVKKNELKPGEQDNRIPKDNN